MPIQPPLLLTCQMSAIGEADWWTEDDNTGDPYLGQAYRWNARITIDGQYHSNHTTAIPNFFGGGDVQVGDWFASGSAGKANRIVQIDEANPNELICIIEDYERYNIFSDSTQLGSGLAPEGTGIIFRLASDGLPALGPIPEAYLNSAAVADLMARFMARNMVRDFVLVKQEQHGMLPGDVIYADFEANSGYKKVTAANFNRAIGIVTEANVPGLSYFSYRPLGRLINNVNPPLWGEHGDVFYLDPNEPGALTNEKPAKNAVPVYLQLDLPTRAILLERGVDSTATGPVAESETNKYDVANVSTGQTTFMMPADCNEVLYMAINGIENENFTFDVTSKVLEFDPIETGYGVDVDDEIFFIYKT